MFNTCSDPTQHSIAQHSTASVQSNYVSQHTLVTAISTDNTVAMTVWIIGVLEVGPQYLNKSCVYAPLFLLALSLRVVCAQQRYPRAVPKTVVRVLKDIDCSVIEATLGDNNN